MRTAGGHAVRAASGSRASAAIALRCLSRARLATSSYSLRPAAVAGLRRPAVSGTQQQEQLVLAESVLGTVRVADFADRNGGEIYIVVRADYDACWL